MNGSFKLLIWVVVLVAGMSFMTLARPSHRASADDPNSPYCQPASGQYNPGFFIKFTPSI